MSVVVFLPFAIHAQGPGGVGVNDLVRLAIENNRELAALRQRLPEARGLRRQAETRPVPTLEFSGTTGRPLGTVGEVNKTRALPQCATRYVERSCP